MSSISSRDPLSQQSWAPQQVFYLPEAYPSFSLVCQKVASVRPYSSKLHPSSMSHHQVELLPRNVYSSFDRQQQEVTWHYEMALDYKLGRKGYQSTDLAIYWFHRAADGPTGHMEASFELGNYYKTSNRELATKYFDKAAQKGHRKAMYALGCCHAEVGDWQAAAGCWFTAANWGHCNAQYEWASSLSKGQGIEKKLGLAFYWWTRASGQGHSMAMYELALCYRHGHGVEPDEARSRYWLEQSAHSGYYTAMYELGCMYAEGVGVQYDLHQAMNWLRAAKVAAEKDGDVAEAKEAYALADEKLKQYEEQDARECQRDLETLSKALTDSIH